jgi:hypothetical protein
MSNVLLFFVLVVVVVFLCAFVFVGLCFWLCFGFRLVFGFCLVVVVVVAYLGVAVTNCSGWISDVAHTAKARLQKTLSWVPIGGLPDLFYHYCFF